MPYMGAFSSRFNWCSQCNYIIKYVEVEGGGGVLIRVIKQFGNYLQLVPGTRVEVVVVVVNYELKK